MKKVPFLAILILILSTLACGLPAIAQKPVEMIETIQQVNEEVSNSSGPSQGRPELPPPAYVPAENMYMVGQEVRSGSVTWMVLGWYTAEEAFMPAPSLYVDVLMVNRSSQLTYVENYYTSKDIQGQDTYDVIWTTLGPGERVREWLTFLLVEAQPSRLVLEADTNYGLPAQRLIWDLGPVPCAVEPPATLEGEKPLPVHTIGESVTMGQMALLVTGVSYPPADNQTPIGYKKVNVDLTIENRGSQDLEIDPAYAAYLKDADGYGYSTIFGMSYATIFPGDSLVTTVKFEIPENIHGLIYEFDGAYLGLGKIFILLQSSHPFGISLPTHHAIRNTQHEPTDYQTIRLSDHRT